MVDDRNKDPNKDRPMNDRREGIMRDPVNWKGQIASYVKDVGNGDQGYDANLRQVVIMTQDGTEKVVPESEITRERKVAPDTANELDRRPDQTLPKSLEGLDEGGNDKNRQARPAVQDRPNPQPAVPERPNPQPAVHGWPNPQTPKR